MTTIESNILGYQKYLTDLTPKPIDNSAYRDLVEKYAQQFSSGTVDFGNDVIAGYLGEYVKTIHEQKDLYPEVYRNVKHPDPFLSDIQWVLDTTIKERRYSRMEAASVEAAITDLKKEIAAKALQMPYAEAINFMGELAGAWVV